MSNNNSNIISNSTVRKNVNQVQNNYAKTEKESPTLSIVQAFQQISELREEVRELKELIKSNNS
jgi:hypothetical protein